MILPIIRFYDFGGGDSLFGATLKTDQRLHEKAKEKGKGGNGSHIPLIHLENQFVSYTALVANTVNQFDVQFTSISSFYPSKHSVSLGL